MKILLFLLCLILITGCSGTSPTLGIKNGQLLPCPNTPNCVNSYLQVDKHFIEPIVFKGSSDEAKVKLLLSLSSFSNAKVIRSETATTDYYLRVEFVSSIFRFVDDVEFYFPERETDTSASIQHTIIHLRSASRVGKSDFGVNRKRIEAIRSLLTTVTR